MSATQAPLANPRVRAAIYVRISDDRAGAGLGVARQEDDCRKLGKQLGVTVVGVYSDNDTEASTGKPRKHYLRMLRDIQAGLIDVVLVWHTDRLHRRPDELEDFIKIAESKSTPVAVHPVKAGKLDLATPSGRMVARMLGAAAKYEMEMKSERQKAASQQKAEAGKPTGGQRPFGFEADGIKHRPKEANAIKQAARAILAGEALTDIARRWSTNGLLTVNSKEWNGTTVRQMLRRPRNAGLREHHGNCDFKARNCTKSAAASARSTRRSCQLFPAVWKPILPVEQWTAVIKVLDNPLRRTSPGNKPRWLMSGIAMCGYPGCDLTMKASASSPGAERKEKSRPIYRCRSGGHLSRTAPDVDDFIERIVIARLSQPDALALIAETSDVDLSALHDEAREIRAKKRAWALDAAEDGGVEPDQLRIINQKLDARLSALEAQIADSTQMDVLGDLAGREDVEERWAALTLTRKRAVVDTLLTVKVLPVGKGAGKHFDPDGLLIEWRKPGQPAVPRQRGNRVGKRATTTTQ